MLSPRWSLAAARAAMYQASILTFAILSALAAASPGPDVLLTVANAVRYGLRRAIAGSLGTIISHALAINSLSLGMRAFLDLFPLALSAIKVIGAIYLAGVGVILLRSRGMAEHGIALNLLSTPPESTLFRRGFLVALTNPKSWLFFLAFMPQFIAVTGPSIPQYAVLAARYAAI